MDRLGFGCICELAEIMNNYIATNASENEYPIVSAYANYDEAKALVEMLIRFGNSIGDIIELEDYEMSHYNKEYRVSLTVDGVACEKIFCEDCYYDSDEDIAFVHEDCNSKLLTHIDSDAIYEFGIVSDEDYEEDCDVCCCECDDGAFELTENTHGFTVNNSDENGYYSYSFYSTDKDLVAEMAKRFR